MKDNVISAHIQDCFIFLCITDTKFLSIARGSIPAKHFSSEVTADIAKLCYNYFDQFGIAPENHLNDELVRFLHSASEEKRKPYLLYLQRLQEMDSPNKEYVTARINKFIQAQEFRGAAVKFVDLMKEGRFEAGKELMQKALRTGIVREEVGLRYLTNSPPTYYSEEGGVKEVVIPTGFSIIDRAIRGFLRKQLVCVFAGFKVGKTWACVHFGRQGLLYSRKVLHISHEASEEELEMRYDMMCGSLVSSEYGQDVEFEEVDDEGKITAAWEEPRDTVYDIGKIRSARTKILRFGGELIIKKYPMGTCTIGEIERYLDYLETFEHFIPDILIDDYVEKSKLPLGESEQHRNRINQAYMDRKRIADERNITVITASQITGAALEKKDVGQQQAAAEDVRKLGNIDIGLTFSQTRKQKDQNRMQVRVLVGRSQEMGFGCTVSTNLKVGQIALDCWRLRSSVENREEDE